MMFTEGLDEEAINWVKQGSRVEQQQRPPLIERRQISVPAIQDPPLRFSSAQLSPTRLLPPLKFHSSGLLGLRPSCNFSDLEDSDDLESVSSTSYAVDMELSSETYEDDGQDGPGSDDSALLTRHSDAGDYEEEQFMPKTAPSLVRTASKKNLRVQIGGRCLSSTSFSCRQKHDGPLTSCEQMNPPSAPPIMEGLKSIFDEKELLRPNADQVVSYPTEEVLNDERICTENELKSFSIKDALLDTDEKPTATCSRSYPKDKEGLCQQFEKSSIDNTSAYVTRGQVAWQTFIAYDACFRLCLNAWARDCTEASEFLRDECQVLRAAFGLQQYLLQPRGQLRTSDRYDSLEETHTMNQKKFVGKVKVEVKKIRIIPQRKLRSALSQRAIYIQSGAAQYARNVSMLLKSGINSLKAASFPLNLDETWTCFIQLKSSVEMEKEAGSAIWLQPGSGDSHEFYPESTYDALLLEVRDSNKAIQGQTTIQISALINTQQTDGSQWWPLYLETDECIGKVQLFISWSSTPDTRSVKSGPIAETGIYDLVLESAMRALQIHPKKLQIRGTWKWLLDEFADYYGVSNAYTKLRYLSLIMNIATPTKGCLQLVYELLLPIIEARGRMSLTRQERCLLCECEAEVERLLATTFKNYKKLDELSPTGLGEFSGPSFAVAAPALVPAVQIYTLLHDILSAGSQAMMISYIQVAAAERCRYHMIETDEFTFSNTDASIDPLTISTAYMKMKTLCQDIKFEIQADIKIHNQHILPSFIDLPAISTSVYSVNLCKRLIAFLKAFPPSKPSQQVIDLLVVTSDFERHLQSWNISPVNGGLASRDLFNDYIMVWIQDMRLHLLELCKEERVPWSVALTRYSTSPFVEKLYDQIRVSLSEYEEIIKRWPNYLVNLENAICDVEHAIVKSLEKQYNDILMPLRDTIPKKIEKQVQKLTRRQSVSLYTIPDQLGTFLNTIKRILDVLHGKVEDDMRSWGAILTVASDAKSQYGEQMNGVVVMLRKKYKSYVQSIVEKLVHNVQANHCMRLKRILKDTKEVENEHEIRERMQVLCSQVADSIYNLHNVFTSRIFVTICRSLWDRMGQIVLSFLESRKENRIWHKAAEYALCIVDDVFASQMQTLQGNSLQDKDIEPPRSIIEARSILC